MKRIVAAVIFIAILGFNGVSVFAASDMSQTMTQVPRGHGQEKHYHRNESGKGFGMIAKENGTWDEFVASREQLLAERVAAGVITQEQADEVLARMQECDGSGIHTGQGLGSGRGLGNGQGQGNGPCKN